MLWIVDKPFWTRANFYSIYLKLPLYVIFERDFSKIIITMLNVYQECWVCIKFQYVLVVEIFPSSI